MNRHTQHSHSDTDAPGIFSSLKLQAAVFALVSASFANIYITQPVLPVLQQEFAADIVLVSFSVSAVILGIALSCLPFGLLSDRLPIQPLILTGGVMVSASALLCSVTHSIYVLIAARFMQGIFIPALTTCVAAYLARTLPAARLNVVLGSYVSATVVGGLTGRLLGGWIHPPLHWRYAFVSVSILTLVATIAALRGLPHTSQAITSRQSSTGFVHLLKRWEFLNIYFCAASSFAVFSTIFNYLPFRLHNSPFNFSTELTTMLYLVYIVGIFMGPAAGRFSDRFGNGNMLVAGCLILAAALGLILMPHIAAVVAGLIVLCAGYFTIHSAAVGSLNRKLTGGHGQANALYMLFYYAGGWLGITGAGFAYKHGGWSSVVYICAALLLVPLSAGIYERTKNKADRPSGLSAVDIYPG
ncbi:MAG: MFS transporter [Nitrospiraceae bacterium]|nr:MFS transporter [Nitrospiraceae bacterium]